MAIRKNQTCFVGGVLVKLDIDEKGRAVGAASAPAPAAPVAAPKAPVKPVCDGKKQADPGKGPSKQELMAQLKALGISFKATMSSADLTALLPKSPVQEPSAKEGGEDGKADGGQGGTGNQDVI